MHVQQSFAVVDQHHIVNVTHPSMTAITGESPETVRFACLSIAFVDEPCIYLKSRWGSSTLNDTKLDGVSKTSLQLWKVIVWQSVRDGHSNASIQSHHTTQRTCTDYRCSMPLHTLQTDMVETCGGSSQTYPKPFGRSLIHGIHHHYVQYTVTKQLPKKLKN